MEEPVSMRALFDLPQASIADLSGHFLWEFCYLCIPQNNHSHVMKCAVVNLLYQMGILLNQNQNIQIRTQTSQLVHSCILLCSIPLKPLTPRPQPGSVLVRGGERHFKIIYCISIRFKNSNAIWRTAKTNKNYPSHYHIGCCSFIHLIRPTNT